jgi:hypothetical protein
MSSRNRNLRNSLEGRDSDPLDDFLLRAENRQPEKNRRQEEPQDGNPGKTFLKVAVIVLIGMFLLKGVSNFSFNPVQSVFSTVVSNQPSEDLLNRMGNRMVEMGYTGLDHDDLRELRSHGVTATLISNVRSLGFEDLSLEDAVRLGQANVSSTFIAMMIELGYDELTIDDFIRLRRAGVTAHFTSNLNDLGYQNIPTDQLIRLQRIGVTTSLVERMQRERGEDVSLEEIIRYRISNQ